MLDVVETSAWYWFALRTPLYREFRAMQALQDRGFAVAVAYEMHRRRKHRHSKSNYYYPVATFSRYIFVGFPDPVPPWKALFDDVNERVQLIDGVVSVTSDGMPSRVRPKIVTELARDHGDRVFVVPERTEASDDDAGETGHISGLKVGDTALIGQWMKDRHGEEFDVGAFVGHVVTIEEIRGPIAKTVMKWFGGEHEVMVPLERLAAA